MKKLLVLFVAVAATITSFAATTLYYFNRAQFQWASKTAQGELLSIMPDGTTTMGKNGQFKGAEVFDVQVTVPMIYQGTIAVKTDWIYEPTDASLTYAARKTAKCLINPKATYPALMTLCQPCIDCYPCETLNIEDHSNDGAPHPGIFAAAENGWAAVSDQNTIVGFPGFITIWNLYVITKVDKKEKQVEYFKVDLIDATNATRFFTGATKGNAYVKSQPADPAGGQINLQLTGSKNDYKFKYYTKYLANDGLWYALEYVVDKDDPANTGYYTSEEASLGSKQTAYIKSIKALNGSIYYNKLVGGNAWDAQLQVLDVAGTVKLTRNAALTGAAIKSTFGVVITKNNAKNWDDCQEADPESSTCEQYFYEAFEPLYFGSKYKNYEAVNIADPANYNAIYGTTQDPEPSNVEDYVEETDSASIGSFFGLFYNPKYEASFKKFYTEQ
ncbi:MAG: hypothetical protein IJS08_12680 [Victivallales bacterium]|nr:hypothetical protein [Victivallales bacterium]